MPDSTQLSQTEETLIERWLRWTEKIHDEVESMLVKRQLYEKYVEIVKANPSIQNPRDYHDWIMRNYFESTLMCIRRLTKPEKRAGKMQSISFMGLLLELKENPQLITMDWYLRDYINAPSNTDGSPTSDSWTHAFGVDTFKTKFGGGTETLHPAVIDADILLLETQTEIVENFIDNALAHTSDDERGNQSIATKHVFQAIKIIEELAAKYIDLMGMGSYTSLSPTFQYNPESIFLKPWIN